MMSPDFRLLVVSREDQREDGTTSHIAGILGTHLSRPLRKAFCLSVCLLAVAVQFAEKVKSSPLTVTSSLYLSLGRAFHPTITLTHRSPRILSSATTKVCECSDLENKFMTDILNLVIFMSIHWLSSHIAPHFLFETAVYIRNCLHRV